MTCIFSGQNKLTMPLGLFLEGGCLALPDGCPNWNLALPDLYAHPPSTLYLLDHAAGRQLTQQIRYLTSLQLICARTQGTNNYCQ